MLALNTAVLNILSCAFITSVVLFLVATGCRSHEGEQAESIDSAYTGSPVPTAGCVPSGGKRLVGQVWADHINAALRDHRDIQEGPEAEELRALANILSKAEGYVGTHYETTISDFPNVEITERQYLAFFLLTMRQQKPKFTIAFWLASPDVIPIVQYFPGLSDVESLEAKFVEHKSFIDGIKSGGFGSELAVPIAHQALCEPEGIRLLHLLTDKRIARFEYIHSPQQNIGCWLRIVEQGKGFPYESRQERYSVIVGQKFTGSAGQTVYLQAPFADIDVTSDPSVDFLDNHVEINGGEVYGQLVMQNSRDIPVTMVGPLKNDTYRYQYSLSNPGYLITPVGYFPLSAVAWNNLNLKY